MSIIDDSLSFINENGADLVGVTSLEVLPKNIKKNFTVGFSIGVVLNPNIINQIIEGPTLEYYYEYKKVNQLLDNISKKTAEYLEIKGYRTDHWGATDDRIFGHYMTTLPHKTLATLSGIGWIGKCALLITNKFGSAVRITSLLTNLDIEVEDKSISKSKCNNCDECVKNCPGKAPKGINWERGIKRETIFDPDICRKTARELAKKRTGIEYTFCGICIASCPYTKDYIKRCIF
jgi:epoxyqueuosine reductase QueG